MQNLLNANLFRFFYIFVIIATIAALMAGKFTINVNAQNILPVDEFPISSYATNITTGPDGNLWFTESNSNIIGKITPNGIVNEIEITPGGNPTDITAGSDGNLWFTESAFEINSIARITTEGAITHFTIPTADSLPQSITKGSDGNVWFTEYNSDKIGRITPSGSITEFPVPNNNGESLYLSDITSGPDGNLWFTEYDPKANKIGRITPHGIITEFPIPTAYSEPRNITNGPDGNIWFIESSYYYGRKIGRITPSGTITEFQVNSSGVADDIITGSDGNLWFTESLNSNIGRITPNGVITEYSVPGSDNRGITLDSSGNLWYLETSKNKIARFNPNTSIITPSSSPSSITLQDFKQNRNADGSFVPWAKQQLYNLSDCATMAEEGCAITSFADVLASYGLAKLPDGTSVDPGSLNNFFAQNPGTHSDCGIYFNTAGRAVNYTVLHNDFPAVSLPTRIQHINEAFDNGNLVIVGVGGHFVVLYKKATSPASDGSPDYYIADPYRYLPYATGDNTGKLLSKTYKSINQLENILQVVVIDNKIPAPGKSWVIVAHSPVKFLVTDPDGNQTGYDPDSSTDIQNIPNSSYGIQQGLIDDTGANPPQPDILYYGQENPIPGEYKVEVIGTGVGEYKLDLGQATGPGGTSLQTISGTAAIGKTDTYTVTAFPDSNTSLVLDKEVTFVTLKADLKSLYERGLIDNKGIYTSLSAKIDVAAKANTIQSNLLRKTLTIAALKTFLEELSAQRGKHIKEGAYQILYNDVQTLIKNLQNNSTNPTPTPVSGGS